MPVTTPSFVRAPASLTVSALVWGADEAEASLASEDALAYAASHGWQVTAVELLYGGKAGERYGQAARSRDALPLHERRDYGRVFGLFAS